MRVIPYHRVSTGMQERSGLGLEAQEAAIRAMAPVRGWELAPGETDVQSGKDTPATRPGWASAIARLRAGEADAVVVAKLDRAARSTIDTLHLLEQSAKEGWGFVALDLNVDTTTNDGRLIATFMAAIAEWERGRIAERISAALQAKKARGEHVGGIPGSDPFMVGVARAAAEHGGSLADIAGRLADWGVYSAAGTPVSKGQVMRLLRAGANEEVEA